MRAYPLLPALFLFACSGASGTPQSDLASRPDSSSPSDGGVPIDGGTVYPDNIDPATAKSLQALLFAAASQTASKPFTCTYDGYTSMGTPIHATGLVYTIVTMPTSSGGPYDDTSRDDNVLFSSTTPIADPDHPQASIDGSQSMDVSYIPTVTPELSVAGDTYTYQFEGTLVDQLKLTGHAGVVNAMTFTKSSDPKQIDVYFRIACTKSS